MLRATRVLLQLLLSQWLLIYALRAADARFVLVPDAERMQLILASMTVWQRPSASNVGANPSTTLINDSLCLQDNATHVSSNSWFSVLISIVCPPVLLWAAHCTTIFSRRKRLLAGRPTHALYKHAFT